MTNRINISLTGDAEGQIQRAIDLLKKRVSEQSARSGALEDTRERQFETLGKIRNALSAADTESLPDAATRVVKERDEWNRVALAANETIGMKNKEIEQARRALGALFGESLVTAAKRAESRAGELSELRKERDALKASHQSLGREEFANEVLEAMGAKGVPFCAAEHALERVRKLAERRDRWRERAETAEGSAMAAMNTLNAIKVETQAQAGEGAWMGAIRLRNERNAWRNLVCEFAVVAPRGENAFGECQRVLQASADPSLATEAKAWRTRICDALGVRKDDPDALAQCCEALRWARATDAAHRSVLDEVRGALGTPEGADVLRWAQAVSETTSRHYRAAQELSESLTAVKAQLREATHREACYLARVLTVG